jgi:hypothetical protein
MNIQVVLRVSENNCEPLVDAKQLENAESIRIFHELGGYKGHNQTEENWKLFGEFVEMVNIDKFIKDDRLLIGDTGKLNMEWVKHHNFVIKQK